MPILWRDPFQALFCDKEGRMLQFNLLINTYFQSFDDKSKKENSRKEGPSPQNPLINRTIFKTSESPTFLPFIFKSIFQHISEKLTFCLSDGSFS